MLVWHHNGITTTCTETWLCIRSERFRVRLRGATQMAKYAQLVRIVSRMYNSQRHSSRRDRMVAFRLGDDGFAFFINRKTVYLIVNSEPELELQLGDMIDQAAFVNPDGEQPGDDHALVESTPEGPTFRDELRVIPIPRVARLPLAALLRTAAAIPDGEPLPLLNEAGIGFQATPASGSSWSKLVIIRAGLKSVFHFGKSTMVRIAQQLEKAS